MDGTLSHHTDQYSGEISVDCMSIENIEQISFKPDVV